MKALDTNVIVRLLVNDDKIQASLVYKMISAYEKQNETLFISNLVFLEVIWVLTSVYKYSKNEIISSFEELLNIQVFVFENRKLLTRLCEFSKDSKLELPDLFIGLSAKEYNCESTITFDKKAAKSKWFSLIK